MYTHIYRLLDADDEIFYVGQAIDANERLKSHKEKYGEDIRMSILRTVPSPWANYYEALYIKQHLDGGVVLKNKQLYQKMPPIPPIKEEEYEELIKSKKFLKEQKKIKASQAAYDKLREENQRIVQKNRVLNVELLRLEAKIEMLNDLINGMQQKTPIYIKGFDDTGQIILSTTKNISKKRPKLFYKPLIVNIDDKEFMKGKVEEIKNEEELYFHLVNTNEKNI